MCSVIGIYSKNLGDVSQKAQELLSVLKHRGPDGFGVKSKNFELKSKNYSDLKKIPKTNFILGHGLLSTTGYSFQPITKGNVSISHNGQIYNFEDFLQKKSENPASDSEVIADFFSKELSKKSITTAVENFVKKASGEYSIGFIYKNKIFAFRDILGLKPLWFGENDSVVAFASEPAALMKIDIQFPQPLLPGYLLEISSKGASTKKILGIEFLKKNISKKHSFDSFKDGFEKTIFEQTKGLKKAAVLFSGGVDSSLIAKAVSKNVKETILFVAGVKESPDVKVAKKTAKEMNLPLEIIYLDEKNISSLAFKCMKYLSFFDEMQIGIAVPELACAEKIKEKGIRVVFSGQGSDEIFAGYSSYIKALDKGGFSEVEKELWFSLSRMWSRNFHRDDIICSRESLELRVPFVGLGFLKEAMAYPAEKKILSKNDLIRKHPIRELAEFYDVPKSVVLRLKKAMQYGSGSQKIVSKLFKGN